MMTKHKQGLFVLLAALALYAVSTDASAQCCGAPSYGAAYQTYSPVAYTAYQPASSWYPGCCLFNWCSGFWGGGYTAAYAPTYSTYYRPAYYASYAPVSSYSTGSSCTTCYTPTCTTCCDPCSSSSSCYSDGCTSCCDGGGCTACGVSQASASDSYPANNYQSQPQLSPSENPSPVRTYESDKPASDNGYPDMFPAPSGDSSDDSASHFEAPPLLINPKDQTARDDSATPVRTAVYRTPVTGQPSKVRAISVSRQQAQRDAEGWTSVAH